ncbi:MAG: 16S rRNA (cytosine(1402)-N(4))-methyltransferase RsmH [Clostridiales Family XIII bacterium]|nr:16S rRNA (cytosine(1402)-N(4))-methyltransferase RsmH [Clostridiales Family XIII bacterium]
MDYAHIPVMAAAVLDGLAVRREGTYVDGTLGGGGHASRVCEKLGPNALFIGIDRDREAIDAAKGRLEGSPCRKVFVHAEFADIKWILRENGVRLIDGALLDLGVSSRQLDAPERGFSYMRNAPLDMRMNRSGAPQDSDALTAYRVVNAYDQDALTRVIRDYGEERWASRIASFIVKERSREAIEDTHRLTEIIKAAIPASARREGPHPAKRTFQAIRIEVNDELGQIERAVDDFVDVLSAGGRLAVITFHSLEDRIVKTAFRRRENPCVCPPDIPRCVCGLNPDAIRVNRKPMVPSERETSENPRARSSKLRVLEKL